MQSEKTENSNVEAKDGGEVPELLQSEQAEPQPRTEKSSKDSHLVFAYLRKEQPLPSPLRARWIV